jgi:ankyrin repeat protein
MDNAEIPDPVFREAVSTIDAGDVSALERLVAAHPGLVRDRIDCGERGARLTLLAAVCTGRMDDVARLARGASAGERQAALAGAALYGRAEALALLIDLGVDLNAYSPPGLHPHGTALHHAVDSGSLDAVKALVEAGAELRTKDRVYEGTPLDWAEHLRRTEIAAYLREKADRR